MDWIDRVSALDFDNNSVADDQVDSIAEVDLLAVINYRQSHLAFDSEALFSKLVDEAGVICAFEQPRPEQSMNSHCSADNLACQVVYSGSNLLRSSSH